MEDYYADDKETEGLLHRCRILSQEMLFFLSNVQGFFMVPQAFRTFLSCASRSGGAHNLHLSTVDGGDRTRVAAIPKHDRQRVIQYVFALLRSSFFFSSLHFMVIWC
jgi:hypothetical protein